MSNIFCEENKTPIQATLTYYADGALAHIGQVFPTTRRELEENLLHTGIKPEQLTQVLDAEYTASVPELESDLPSMPNLDELNHLAHLMKGMSEEKLLTFSAVLETGEYGGSMADIINAAENVYCFDLFPGHFSERELGGILAETQHEAFEDAVDRLRTSGDLNDNMFAKYIERMQQSLDLTQFGKLAQEAEGGELTESGYLIQATDPLPQKYTGPQDIPAEHRVTDFAPELPQSEHKPSLLEAVAALKTQQAAKDAEAPARDDRPEKGGPEL